MPKWVLAPQWIAMLLAATVCMTVGRSLSAQTGSTRAAVDTIQGRIVGPDSQPAYGALVEVVPENGGGKPQRTVTDKTGAYTVVVSEHADAYMVTIRALGFRPTTIRVIRSDVNGALTGNTVLTQTARLATVEVRAQRPHVSRGTHAIAASEVSDSPDPVEDMSDPWLALDPTHYALPGMDPADNRISVNGVTVQSVLPPAATSSNGRFVTSTSDPAAGGFGGGQITYDMTALGVDANLYMTHFLLAPAGLQWTDQTSSITGARTSTYNASLDFANPLVKGVRHRSTISIANETAPLPRLPRTAAGLARFGLLPDSVDRFVTLMDGLDIAGAASSQPASQTTRRMAWITTLDGGDFAHDRTTFSVTLNAGQTESDAVGASPLARAMHNGTSRQSGAFAIGTVEHEFAGAFLTHLTGAVNRFVMRTEPYTHLPEGTVRIGDSAITWMTFGGNANLNQRMETTTWQTQSSMQWRSMNGLHRFEIGGGVRHEQSRATDGSNTLGQFEFASLDDLAAGRAARFTRVINAPQQATAGTVFDVYGSDTWTQSSRFAVQYGLRIDGMHTGMRPAYNLAVDSVFGYHTDFIPHPISVSPRLGFTRFYGWDGPWASGISISSIQLTAGQFQSATSVGELASFVQNTGLPSSTQLLQCVGDAVPTPQWDAYREDIGLIPSACADGGGAQPQASNAPLVRLFGRGYRPTTRRTVDIMWRNRKRVPFLLRVLYSHLTRPGDIDLNLARTPRFTLPLEDDRPVYAAADAIVPSTGAAALDEARVAPRFGSVRLTTSDLTSDLIALTLGRRFVLPYGTSVTARYQYLRGYENTRGFDGLTSGDPFHVERSPLSENGHSLFLGFQWRRTQIVDDVEIDALTTNLFVTLRSGSHYTPRIAQDVNLDGLANDIAFIFDPATLTPTQPLAQGMAAVLAQAPHAARTCLTAQLGRMATSNSCRGPWTATADAQITYTLPGNRGTKLRVDLPNVAGLLDQLLHGQSRHGWGDPAYIDPTLLTVTGFDPTTRQFRYNVNRRFGRRLAIHMPFAIRLRVDVPIGPSLQSQTYRKYAHMIRTAQRDSQDVFKSFLPYLNPFEAARYMNEALHVTAEQDTALRAAERGWQREVDAAGTELNRYMDTVGTSTDDLELLAAVQRTGRSIAELTLKWALPIGAQFSHEQLATMAPYLRYWFTGKRSSDVLEGIDGM